MNKSEPQKRGITDRNNEHLETLKLCKINGKQILSFIESLYLINSSVAKKDNCILPMNNNIPYSYIHETSKGY